MGWVDPWVELGWIEIFQFLVGLVGSTVAKVLKFERIMLMHLKHQAVKCVTCSGLGQSVDGLGWIGSYKMDRWTTLLLLPRTHWCM